MTDEVGGDFTLERRYQKHPVLTAACHLPAELTKDLSRCHELLREESADARLAKHIESLSTAVTPEAQLRVVSQIIGLFSQAPHPSTLDETSVFSDAVKAAVARYFVFSWLLDCRVRYTHKALIGLAKSHLSSYTGILEELFVTRHLGNSTAWIHGEGQQLHVSAHRDVVMHFINCLDAITVTVVPAFRSAFEAQFVPTLVKLGQSINWALDHAFGSRQRRGSAGAGGSEEGDGGVFGEDLDLIRFCVRVVATHVHKFLPSVSHVLFEASTDADVLGSAMELGLTELLLAAVRMLSSPMLPKDVLNAAGLLFASISTVGRVHQRTMFRVCNDAATGGARRLATAVTFSVQELRQRCRVAVAVLLQDGAESGKALGLISQHFTDNGRFAFFKGLLSHFSSPLHNMSSLTTLLVAAADGSVIHDVIVPNAELFCSEVQEPDTRFMAIQTLDAVVRHIATIFRVCTTAMTSAVKHTPTWHECENTLRTLCDVTPALRRTVEVTVRVIMSLWDDPTQQVSGPLYDTYSVVLSVSEAAGKASCALGGPLASVDLLVNPRQAFSSVLSTQNDRRGKYHALLAIAQVLPMHEFLESLVVHFNEKTTDAALRRFNELLIAGACNSKICSVCGEVLAAVTKLVIGCDEVAFSTPEAKALWRDAFISPIAAAACGGAAAFRGLNISAAQATSNVLAHMLTPLLKRWPHQAVSDTLHAIIAHSGGGAAGGRSTAVIQAVVETLSRARNGNVDTSSFATPENGPIFDIICEALQAYEFELRNTAFNLCTIPLKASEPVTAWQTSIVARYILLNLHQGGDSTARNALLQSVRKWVKRICDSLLSSKTRTGVSADPKKQKKLGVAPLSPAAQNEKFDAYVALVVGHLKQVVSTIAGHFGTSIPTPQLSVERRYTALSIFQAYGDALLPLLVKDSDGAITASFARLAVSTSDVIDAMLPTESLPVLLETLSEGWDKIRCVATSILRLYSQYKCSAIAQLAQSDQGHESDELLSPKFKVTEGAVRRRILFSQLAAANDQTIQASVLLADLSVALQRVESQCASMKLMSDGLAMYTCLRDAPLHGYVAWIGALVESQSLLLARESPASRRAVNDQVLVCCRSVVEVCTALVSGQCFETSNHDDATAASATTKIDCRGHVYHTEGTEAESLSRIVVNNSWLGIRAAASVIEALITPTAFDVLSASTVFDAAASLVNTLLKTKHNGVMSKCRQALKSICTALLRTKRQEFYDVPSRLLLGLLGSEGVASDDEYRVLRRSQGLPHAILPLLEAEDAAVPLYLFPLAMRSLVHLAQEGKPLHCEEGAADTRPASLVVAHRVNAINVLKFVFDDKVFASRVVPHIQDTFLIAVSGFRHASWPVRNSSLMLFSSVLHRFVGDHPSMGGAGVNNSFHDIAARIPRGVQFVVEELEAAVKQTEDGLASNTPDNSHRSTQAILFPALLMLSMLTPDAPHLVTHVTDRTPASGVKATATEIPNVTADDGSRATSVVLRCRRLRDLMVRGASAKALCGLVPVSRISDVIRELGALLNDARLRESGMTLNAFHGAVAHLHQFLRHYVGTIHEGPDGRPVCAVSSHYSKALAKGVLKDVTNSLCRCREQLMLAALQVPTIAAQVFAIVGDVVYFSHFRHMVRGSNLVEDAMLDSLIAQALTCSRAFVEMESRSAVPWGADMVAAKRTLGMMLAVIAQHAAVHDAAVLGADVPSSPVRDLRSLLHAESSAMLTAHLRTRRCTIFWMAHHIASRCGESTISLSPHRRKTDVFTRASAAAVIAWLNTHVFSFLPADEGGRFGLRSLEDHMVIQLRALTAASQDTRVSESGSAGPWSIALHEKLASTLQFLLRNDTQRLEQSRSAVLAVLTSIPYTEAKCWAIQALAHMPLAESDDPLIEESADAKIFVFHTLSCSDMSMPVACRLGAVEAIRIRLAALSGRSPARLHMQLQTVLLRLLFDDDEDVRHAACVVVTAQTTSGMPPDRCFCHVSSVLALVRALRVHTKDWSHADEAFLSAILLEDENHTAAASEAAVGGDDDDGDDDALFSAESDNMFAELACLKSWIACVMHTSPHEVTDVQDSGLRYVSLLREVMQSNAAAVYWTP